MFTVEQRSKLVGELGAWLDDHGHRGCCCHPEELVAFVEKGCGGCKDWWEPLGVPKAVDCVLLHPADNTVWALCQHCVWDKESHQCGDEDCPGPWPPVEDIFYLPAFPVIATGSPNTEITDVNESVGHPEAETHGDAEGGPTDDFYILDNRDGVFVLLSVSVPQWAEYFGSVEEADAAVLDGWAAQDRDTFVPRSKEELEQEWDFFAGGGVSYDLSGERDTLF